MDKITGMKIKNSNGTYSDQVPIGVVADNVTWDSTHSLTDVLQDVIERLDTLEDVSDALDELNGEVI